MPRKRVDRAEALRRMIIAAGENGDFQRVEEITEALLRGENRKSDDIVKDAFGAVGELLLDRIRLVKWAEFLAIRMEDK